MKLAAIYAAILLALASAVIFVPSTTADPCVSDLVCLQAGGTQVCAEFPRTGHEECVVVIVGVLTGQKRSGICVQASGENTDCVLVFTYVNRNDPVNQNAAGAEACVTQQAQYN